MKQAFARLVERFLDLEFENRKWRADHDALYASVTNLRKENAELREGLEKARAFIVPPRPEMDDNGFTHSLRAAPARSHSATCQPAAILSQEVTSPNPAK